MAQHFDLIVIGSGPAGRRAAVRAAKLKKSVLVVERGRRVGGVCVHTGTIPSKTLCETVLNLFGWRERGFYGRAHRNKDDITAEDLRRRLHISVEWLSAHYSICAGVQRAVGLDDQARRASRGRRRSNDRRARQL
jgi:pyruvate/2-oxoglutarate dehydrogenase complex dihydrolipoamide dehydrogenase (E3) component